MIYCNLCGVFPSLVGPRNFQFHFKLWMLVDACVHMHNVMHHRQKIYSVRIHIRNENNTEGDKWMLHTGKHVHFLFGMQSEEKSWATLICCLLFLRSSNQFFGFYAHLLFPQLYLGHYFSLSERIFSIFFSSVLSS